MTRCGTPRCSPRTESACCGATSPAPSSSGCWPRRRGGSSLSAEHFTVDGTLIEAWAGLKSFKKKGARGRPPDDPGNPTVNFHGERRANATHASTTDPEARLTRKSQRARGQAGLPGTRPDGEPAWAGRRYVRESSHRDCGARDSRGHGPPPSCCFDHIWTESSRGNGRHRTRQPGADRLQVPEWTMITFNPLMAAIPSRSAASFAFAKSN